MARSTLMLVCLLVGCRQESAVLSSIAADDSIFATGLYEDRNPERVASGVAQYTPRYPLWSDGLDKQRWIYLPTSEEIRADDVDRWVFPVGTKFWKEFAYNGRIETRYMEKLEDFDDIDAWEFRTYRWNAEQTDAHLMARDGLADAAPTPFGTTHDIPSQSDCVSCHDRGGDAVLGFDALQLSGEGAGVKLSDLRSAGQIVPANIQDENIPADAGRFGPLFGYLHGNCGNCHNPRARAGRQSPLHLRYIAGAVSARTLPAHSTSVGVLTERYAVPDRTLGEDSYQIEAGAPGFSAVYLRSAARGSEEAMPPMASKVVDEEYRRLLEQWIVALEEKQ